MCVCLLTFTGSYLFGGIASYYSFDYGSEPYIAITGTQINFTYTDDDISSAVDIGFTFPYCGEVVTQVKISTNGFINPGATWPYPSSNNQLIYGIYPIIAPLWDNLSMAGGNVQYQTSGEAPNRSFTVQYYHARWPYNVSTAWINFQVVLYESGLIKFIYGNNLGSPSPGSASIGINMPYAGGGNFFSVTPGNPPTVSSTSENYQINAYPLPGTVYSFVSLPLVVNDLAVTNIIPPSYSTCYYDLNQSFVVPVTVVNNATQAIEDYDVVLLCENQELARCSGVMLTPGQSNVFNMQAVIDSSGMKTITAVAELPADEYPGDNSMSYTCIVRPDPSTGIIFGAGDENLRIPFDLFWRYSLYETLYYPDEIGSTGLIYGVSFFNDFVSNNIQPSMRLWIGETNNADLSEGWIPAGQLTQVLDADITLPYLQNEIYLPFSTPYHYQGQNLVLMAYQHSLFYTSGQDYFQAQTLPGLRAMNRYSDAYNPDPYSPPANITPYDKVPKIAFYISPASGVNDEVIPAAFSISNYPNPFTTDTKLIFDLPRAQNVNLSIYNLKGQLVKTLLNGNAAKGRTSLTWNGTDEQGTRVSSGVYFYRLNTGSKSETRKMLLLR